MLSVLQWDESAVEVRVMLSKEQNERLTQVGPGTPMGELMRRYWQPIAGSVQLNDETPTARGADPRRGPGAVQEHGW